MTNAIVTNPQNLSDSPFNSIRHFDEHGNEFWYARELQPLLGYTKWQRFIEVIEKAKLSFLTQPIGDIETHFTASEKNSKRSNGKGYTILDFKLSRHFCYLVAMNGDVRKPEIASAQTYFSVMAHKAETVIPQLQDDNETLRLMLELERERNRGKQLDSAMLTLHGDRVVLALRGLSNQIIEKETVVTEVVEPEMGTSTKILTADQLKKVVRERTGQKLRSLKDFTDSLRKAGRDDLLVPVRRSPQTSEYPIPERIDEAIAVVYGKVRQRLIGE